MKIIFLILIPFLIQAQSLLLLMDDGSPYSAEATQYFDRLPTEVDADTLAVYATFIDSLVLLGYWDRIDEMGILANKTSANALIGLKGYKDAVLVGVPTFTVYQGFVGGTGKAINTQLAPDPDGVNFTLNAGSFGIYSRTQDLTAKNDMGTNSAGTDQSVIYITTDTYYARVNGSNWNANVASVNSQGFFCADRYSSTKVGVIINGVYDDNSSTAGSLCTNTFYVLAQNGGSVVDPSPRQIAFWYIGGSFSEAEHIILNRLVEAMLDGIGAGVVE